ncbi:cytochrome P450 [Celeribacter baekdonensis]|uniref:Cytochrome P450 n=2 Tax=Celeribacter baekdonensis TaxID=875171 RepID=A0A2R4M591_9RHOB|nr:cytochrome P450 [Celeribacter baekdonensis]|tara:strand:+ start:4324 stop:5514 length:1191 start_codon:yes stop_codon:yes gene_type:complete
MNDIMDAPRLDISKPGFSMRSQEVADARAKSWFAYTPYGIAALRYDAVKELVMSPSLRQGSYKWPDHNDTHGVWAQWWKRIMLNKEGEDHTRLRRLGQPAFAPKLVKSLLPSFQALADELISKFEARGECEFMADFAEPYATRVICQLVGLSDENWREFADLAVEMGYALGVNYKRDEARVDAAATKLINYAKALVEERRAAPRDDFVGNLIAASGVGGQLSEQELYDMIVLTIFGGVDTTRNQIGLAMSSFLEHPDQWALLGQNPDLGRAAVEEVMRTRPTTTWVTREAAEDFEYRGLRIEKGTTVHLFSAAASTDPEHFEDGFDITKTRKPHFGFGGGKHHCIGSPIARGDMTEALKLLSQRLLNPRLNGAAEWLPDSGNTGPLSLPIAFDKAL